MWVDVVCLRKEGVKLSPDELAAVPPLRARLTMDTVVLRADDGHDDARRADVAQLWPDRDGDTGGPLGALEYARISRVGGAGLLIVGVEAADGAPAHAQAWWCRLVLPEDDGARSDAGPATEWHDTLPGTLPATLTQDVAPHESASA